MKILETPRLILRTWTITDAEALFEICRDAAVMRFIGTGKPYKNLEEAKQFLRWAENYERENGFCRWAVTEKASGKIIGSCGFARPYDTQEIELGYLFAREVWGNGVATEAAGACLKYGFDVLKFKEVIAMTDPPNAASQKVLEKIGFVRRGIEKHDDEYDIVYLAKNSGIT